MKRNVLLFGTIVCILTFNSCSYNKTFSNKILFDFDWRFTLGNLPDAEKPEYDDSKWRSLDLPHDFSIEQPFDSLNSTGPDGGYTFSGVGWYRKHFVLSERLSDKRFVILFNGIYRNSEVWINGHYLGYHPYGYTSFYYDITPFLYDNGKENILAVKVNTTEQPNSRWFTGAGIYRHVWLISTGKLHFNQWGVFARTIKANENQAIIHVSIELKNENIKNEECNVTTVLLSDQKKKVTGSTTSLLIKSGDSIKMEHELIINNPVLWSIGNPYLYKLQTTVKSGEKTHDVYSTSYGIRTFHFDHDQGFYLNEERIKLKGTNNHHDGGPLGAACMDYTFERQLKILKSMGCNALRMSHNPPTSELLDCADSLGFVVINEIFDEWMTGKRKAGYSPYFKKWYKNDIASWIRRDRNHPSIIAWSLGNEVVEQRRGDGPEILQMLINEAKKHDTSRPFTAGCNEVPSINSSGFANLLDIVGYNYREAMYLSDHKKYPERIIYGSETAIYPYHPGNDFPLHTYKQWLEGQTQNYIIGEFLWTGFDYIGEAGIGAGGTNYEPWLYWPKWPWRSANCGVIDLCGFQKPGYWLRKALWTDDPVLYIAVQTDPSAKDRQIAPFWGWPEVWPHWNHNKENDTLVVHVYTNYTEVELLLNGKSFGRKKWDLKKEAFLTWFVPYEKGVIEAIGTFSDGSKKFCRLQTAKEPAKIILQADKKSIKANKQDLSYIEIQILDNDNVLVPFSDKMIEFEISGVGKLRAVGNGNPMNLTLFNGKAIETYKGKCLAIVQSDDKKGDIIIKAHAENLTSAELKISVK